MTKTVLACGRLFDGLSDALLGPTEILLDGDTIAEIGATVGRPPGASVIDLSAPSAVDRTDRPSLRAGAAARVPQPLPRASSASAPGEAGLVIRHADRVDEHSRDASTGSLPAALAAKGQGDADACAVSASIRATTASSTASSASSASIAAMTMAFTALRRLDVTRPARHFEYAEPTAAAAVW